MTLRLHIRLSCLALLSALAGCGEQHPCPEALRPATRLVLVTTETMNGPIATLSTYERASPGAAWTLLSPPEPAVVGSKGLAWGHTFQHLAQSGDSLKIEGDKRTPAGIFALGAPFGFAASAATGYLQLSRDQHVCVDEPKSPYYSRIVTRAEAGEGTSGEEMASIAVYERGLVVDYPTDREARAGSCIFLHIWTAPGDGTSGCVAAPEATIARLQDLTAGGPAVIAIVPQSARARLASCLEVP